MATGRPKHAGRDRSQEAELKFRLAGAAEQARLRSRLREIAAVNEGSYDEENFRREAYRAADISLIDTAAARGIEEGLIEQTIDFALRTAVATDEAEELRPAA